MFGRTVEVVNPLDIFDKQKTIQLAELTPVYLQVLQASKITAAVQSFQDAVENTVKGLAASENILDSMSDVPAGMFDAVFITCLRNFRWAKDPYNMDRESVRDRVGIPHFAAPGKKPSSIRNVWPQDVLSTAKNKLVKISLVWSASYPSSTTLVECITLPVSTLCSPISGCLACLRSKISLPALPISGSLSKNF
jgi:hypothetical protein